ncbi:MAG: rod shape-determining protein [Planctomycetes bacterium]|nr:rod shape-determining protein [Planctomycetota bacterium]
MTKSSNNLGKIPPELLSDLINQGIVLTGGGALLRGIDGVIQKDIQIPVRIAENPISATAKELGIVLEKLQNSVTALKTTTMLLATENTESTESKTIIFRRG